jgi:branched-chain amino acid transport system substrate-binding protein
VSIWRTRRWQAHVGKAATATACGLALLAVGCGAGDGGGGDATAAGKAVTIYSSLPLQGASRSLSSDVVDGIKLALEQAGNKAGKWPVRYISLDDSTAQAGQWDPGQTTTNARRAIQDKSTVAFLGDYNSGATALSLPMTNEAGIAQVSMNASLGLTQKTGVPGEPEKYYPSGRRTYVRIWPPDNIQAGALLAFAKSEGVGSLYLLDDKEVYGQGIANLIESGASDAGVKIAGRGSIDPRAPNYRSLADNIRRTGADGVFFGGIEAANATQLWRDLSSAMPDAKLLGPDGITTASFAKTIGKAERQTLLTAANLPAENYPASGREFFAEFEKKHGRTPDTFAIYGYEMMALTLDAIARAGDRGNDKQVVLEQLYETRDRDSVLGTYSIDKNGDTTLNAFGGYGVKDGKLKFVRTLSGPDSGS